MNDRPHIIIIGAGLIGLSSADSLLARGWQVTLIERHALPGMGTSFSNSGMIHPSQSMPWIIKGVTDHLGEVKRLTAARDVLDLARRSTQLLKMRMRELNLPDSYRPPGVQQIFDTDETRERFKQRYEDLGIVARAHPGGLNNQLGLFFPDDRSGNAYDYCQALAKDITARGGTIIRNAESLRIDNSSGRTKAVSFKTGESVSIKADHIVLAAGPQSRSLGASIGIDFPVIPVEGYALNFTRPDIDLPTVPVMHYDSHSAFSVFDDHVRISGGHDLLGANNLWEIWRALAPKLIKALGDPLSEWSGDRPMSRTGKPLIGRTGIPNLWVNTGHGHMGWTLCAGSGELMADMIMDGRVDDRFALPPEKVT